MATRLWNYVSTFSNLKGDKLAEIYKKLRQEGRPDHVRASSQDANHGTAAGPSGRDEHAHPTGSSRRQGPPRTQNTAAGDSEAWKRWHRDDLPSGGGPPEGPHNSGDRRKWEGRPGSADGWKNNRGGHNARTLGGSPAPSGAAVNGSGWGHDIKDREDRGPWGPPHDRSWSGEGRGGDWNRREHEDRGQRQHHPRSGPPYGHGPSHAPAFTH